MAMTLDGKIAKHTNHLANWTSKEDKQFFVKTSKDFGVIMMGETTFETFKQPLPNRLNVVFSKKEHQPKIKDVKWVSGDPKKILNELETMGFSKALLGGGSTLNSLFLKEKLIDEILITVEPKIFGHGLSLFNEEFDINLELKETKQLSNNVLMLRYKVKYE